MRLNWLVTFAWSEVGAQPHSDEIEITTFGPGFGESTIIHIGDGKWIIVDSCIDTTDATDRRSVAEKYLRAMGVDLACQVELIVATHWHDDHVRGLGQLLYSCKSARFSCASSLLNKEFITYIEEMATGATATAGAKVSEFRSVLRVMREGSRKPIKYSSAGRELLTWRAEELSHRESCVVRVFSPSDEEYSIFLRDLASLHPKHGEAKRAAVARIPNLSSVVMHLQFDSFAILLGADMETHSCNLRGCAAAVDEAIERRADRSVIFKVAHHGSINGDYPGIWKNLLLDTPVCIVTPFNKLPRSKKLPTDADVTRLSQRSGKLFLTSQPGNAMPIHARDSVTQRSLRESGIKLQNIAKNLGAVRLRRKVGACAMTWNTELLGAAFEILK